MKAKGIHHVQVCIPPGSEDEARDFYCGVLGFTETPKPQALRSRGGFWLEVVGQQLHIGVEDLGDRAASKAHVAYLVDDLDAWKERFRELGVEVTDGIEIPGFIRAELRDPFGNRIELIQPA